MTISNEPSEVDLITEWLLEHIPKEESADYDPSKPLRVDIHGGRTRSPSRAQKALQGIVLRPGSDAKELAGLIARKLDAARLDGHRHVFLKLFEHGKYHAADQLPLDGAPSDDADEVEADGVGVNGSIAKMFTTLTGALVQSINVRDDYLRALGDGNGQLARYEAQIEMANNDGSAQALARAAEALAPHVPAALDTLREWAARGDPPPPKPDKPRQDLTCEEHAHRAAAAIDELIKAVQRDGEAGVFTPEREAAIRAIVTPGIVTLIGGRPPGPDPKKGDK